MATPELADLVLTGPRLTLRPWRPEDVAAVYAALRDDPAAARFTTVPAPYSAADAEAFVTRTGNAGRVDGSELGCAAVETATGRLVGSASLRLPANEIGYIVYPHARGNGYAAEATRVLTEWAFAHGAERVYLNCDITNVASARTAMKAGFEFEGIAWHAVAAANADRLVDLATFARLVGDAGHSIPPQFAPLPLSGLSDGVVSLRCLNESDLDASMQTDDELTLAWAFSAEPNSRERVRRACTRAALDWLVGSVAALAVVDVASGRFAGSLRLRQAGPPQVGGLGYVVHPDFRGRGYTTRALRLLVPWAFEVAGFARLELGAKVGNVASQRAALNAGFQPDGVRAARMRNPDGTFGDEARFALVNPAIRRT
jgi:RimJ/RimL family protein N-acetyltransferase